MSPPGPPPTIAIVFPSRPLILYLRPHPMQWNAVPFSVERHSRCVNIEHAESATEHPAEGRSSFTRQHHRGIYRPARSWRRRRSDVPRSLRTACHRTGRYLLAYCQQDRSAHGSMRGPRRANDERDRHHHTGEDHSSGRAWLVRRERGAFVDRLGTHPALQPRCPSCTSSNALANRFARSRCQRGSNGARLVLLWPSSLASAGRTPRTVISPERKTLIEPTSSKQFRQHGPSSMRRSIRLQGA